MNVPAAFGSEEKLLAVSMVDWCSDWCMPSAGCTISDVTSKQINDQGVNEPGIENLSPE
jgi:hypothetical protein